MSHDETSAPPAVDFANGYELRDPHAPSGPTVARSLMDAVTAQMAALQAEANQWKALAALLLRAHGRQQGGSLVYETSLGELVALTDGAWELTVEKTPDAFRFVLRPEAAGVRDA